MSAGELTFLHGLVHPQCDHDINKKFVGYYTLQYMTGGCVSLQVGSRHYQMEGPWFWSAYPGPQIAFHASPRQSVWQHRYVAFRGSRVRQWIASRLFPIEPQMAPPRPDLAIRFDEMLHLFREKDQLAALRAVHILEGILLDLAIARSVARRRPDWLASAIAMLESAVGQSEVDYPRICARLMLSESTLRRGFQQALGVSPHEYLINARIAKARQMLSESNLPIKHIAQVLGYSDLFYFSRQFRQVAGLPPAAYRRSIERSAKLP